MVVALYDLSGLVGSYSKHQYPYRGRRNALEIFFPQNMVTAFSVRFVIFPIFHLSFCPLVLTCSFLLSRIFKELCLAFRNSVHAMYNYSSFLNSRHSYSCIWRPYTRAVILPLTANILSICISLKIAPLRHWSKKWLLRWRYWCVCWYSDAWCYTCMGSPELTTFVCTYKWKLSICATVCIVKM